MNGVCDKFCKGCIYCQYATGDTFICAYYLKTNIRRPCPAGTGCTVKNTGKKKGAWEYQNDAEWAKKMKKAREVKRVVRTVICAECGAEFETTEPQKMYCSKRCKDRVSQRNAHRRYLDAKAKLISGKTGSTKAEML